MNIRQTRSRKIPVVVGRVISVERRRLREVRLSERDPLERSIVRHTLDRGGFPGLEEEEARRGRGGGGGGEPSYYCRSQVWVDEGPVR